MPPKFTTVALLLTSSIGFSPLLYAAHTNPASMDYVDQQIQALETYLLGLINGGHHGITGATGPTGPTGPT